MDLCSVDDRYSAPSRRVNLKTMSTLKGNASGPAWRDSCLVDIHRVDEQHKGLFITLDKLQECILRQGDVELIDKLFSDLDRQTKAHFQTEELLMKQYDYPNYEKHKHTHDLLISQLESMQVAQKKTEYRNFHHHWTEKLEIADFLSSWVLSHVTHEDKMMAIYLKSKGAE